MYTIYVKFECFKGKREAFLEKVKETGVLSAIRNENGCIKYDFYLSEDNADELLLVEKWETKEHQQVHMTQPHMEQFRSFREEYIKSSILGEIEVKG